MTASSLKMLVAALAVAVACKGEDPFVPVVTTITVTPGTRAFTALGLSQQFAAAVLDQRGGTMMGQSVVWGTSSGTVASVTAGGLVTASGPGNATITATIGSVQGQATVTVTQTPTTLQKFDGDNQFAPVGSAVGVPLVVRVLDAQAFVIANVAVTFTVTAGGGSVGTPNATSNASGQASTTWTLGTGTGPQLVTASATGVPSVIFTATGLAAAADTISKQTTDGQNVPAGTPVTPAPAVLVRDQFGNPVSGVNVTFAVTGGGGLVTGATQATSGSGIATVGSWIVGPSGAQTLNASAAGSGIGGNPVTFTVTALAPGAPASIVVSAGNNQTGLFGYAVNVPPAAQVRDASSNPVQGVTVDFAVTAGGGGVTGASATTDLQGVARVGSWTINLGANSLEATTAGVGSPATFTATGDSSRFKIEVRYPAGTSPTAAQMAAFDSAAARWSRVIFADLSDLTNVMITANSCNNAGLPSSTENIDDLLIFAVLVPIDGPNGILGSAGPCAIRNSNQLSVYGLMRFDTADLANMESQGILEDVILHEMAHVLGVGTLWQTKGLLTGAGGADPFFTGAQARAQFDAIGGAGYTAGGKVPVENSGGSGTRDGHWRESVFVHELMTGFISALVNPLSTVTSAQFIDLGYTVNLAASDAFSVTVAALRAAGAGLHLGEDVLRMPIDVLDARGRVTRVIQPQ